MRLDIRAIKKTMMTRTISRLFICYFALWLALSAVGKFISNQFFISSQISFFASLIILTASFFAYKNRINSRLENARDEILAKIEEEDEEDEEILPEGLFKGKTVTLQHCLGHAIICNSHLISFLL